MFKKNQHTIKSRYYFNMELPFNSAHSWFDHHHQRLLYVSRVWEKENSWTKNISKNHMHLERVLKLESPLVFYELIMSNCKVKTNRLFWYLVIYTNYRQRFLPLKKSKKRQQEPTKIMYKSATTLFTIWHVRLSKTTQSFSVY